MNIEKSRVEVVSLTLGTTSDQEFLSLQDVSLKPGQVIWIQAYRGENYQIRFDDTFAVSQLRLERQGDDVVVHFPNGGKVVLRDLAAHSVGQSIAQIRDQLLGVEGREQDQDADEQQAQLVEEERARQEKKRKEAEEERELREQAELAAAENIATDGEPMTDSSSYASGSAGQSGGNAVSDAHQGSEDSGPGAALWAGLGLLGAAGIAYGLNDDDESQAAAPTFSGGSDATASVEEGTEATEVVYQADASVDGDTDHTVTYSLAGPDAASFEIDANSGEVRLREVADFETKNSYDITVIATNEDGVTSQQQVSVSVEDVVTTVSGRVIAGPLLPDHGLTAEFYDADGESLGTAEVDAQGNYTAVLRDGYAGPVLVRISDHSDEDDYLHEGSGEGGDLTSDLRALGHVDAGESLALNVNPLSEILTRMVLGDGGGDAGQSSMDMGDSVTQEAFEDAKKNLSEAFGLDADVDINAHATRAVNEAGYEEASAETKAVAALLAALAGAEVAAGESMTDVLNSIIESMMVDDDGAELSASARQLLAEGAEVADSVEGNADGIADAIEQSIPLSDAQIASLATITEYVNSEGASTAPALSDYTDAGVTGVTADNLAAVNVHVLSQDLEGINTVIEIQTLVTAANNALTKIEAYNNGDGTTPPALTLQDYADAGITGVMADNLDAVNAEVLAADPGEATTVASIQSLADNASGLSITGTFTGGPAIEGNDLVAKAFDAQGNMLGESSLNADGTYSIRISGDYVGPMIVMVYSSDDESPDYQDEGTGEDVNLSTNFRAVTYSTGDDLVVNANAVTEAAARLILEDEGVHGDPGDTIVLPSDVTDADAQEINENNDEVAKALGLEGTDIISDDVVATNDDSFDESSESAQDYGRVLAAISGLEQTEDAETTDVLQELVESIDDGVLDTEQAEKLQEAADHVEDLVDDSGAPVNASGTDDFFGEVFDVQISDIRLSVDSGSDNTDSVTNVAQQTITATLTESLPDSGSLWGRIDDGAWAQITPNADLSISWTAELAEGDGRIQLAVTNDGLAPAADGSNVDGDISNELYTLNTSNPSIASVVLSWGDALTAGEEGSDGSVTVTTGGVEDGQIVSLVIGDKTYTGSAINNSVMMTVPAADLQALAENSTQSFTVDVSDFAGNAAPQYADDFRVNVSNEPLTPFEMGEPTSFIEGSASEEDAVATVATAPTDADGGAISYSIDDTTHYAINATTGEVTLTAAGAALVNAGSDLPEYTVTAASASTGEDTVSSTDVRATPAATDLLPTVVSAVISATDDLDSPTTDTLVAGDKILVTVTMSEATTVTGAPTYTIDVGGESRAATYVAGSGTDSLVFSYTVADGDTDDAGVLRQKPQHYLLKVAR